MKIRSCYCEACAGLWARKYTGEVRFEREREEFFSDVDNLVGVIDGRGGGQLLIGRARG